MGNSNQPNNQNLNQKLYEPAEYEQVETITNPRYGKATILREKKTQQLFAHVQRTLTDQNQWSAQLQEIYFRKQLSHPNLLQLKNYNSEKSAEFCSSFFKINLLYQYLNISLQQEISERQKLNLNYQEGELWCLLDSLVNGALYLKQKGVFHGDVRPYNVLLTEQGQVKLAEQFSSNKKQSAAQQIMLGLSQDFYLSPQHLQTIAKQQPNASLDYWKGDVFSIAATVLEAATLQNVSDTCYQKQELQVNFNQIESLLSKVRVQHSERLSNVLQRMLLENELQRPSLDDIALELQNDQQVQTKKLQNLQIIRNSQTPMVVNNNLNDNLNISDDEMDRRIEAALNMSRAAVARYNNSPNSVFKNSTSAYQQVEDQVKRNKKSSTPVENITYQSYVPAETYTSTYQIPTTSYQVPSSSYQTVSYQPLTDYQPVTIIQQQPVVYSSSVSQNPVVVNSTATDNITYSKSYSNYNPPVISYPVVEQEVVKRSQNRQQETFGQPIEYTTTYVQPAEYVTSNVTYVQPAEYTTSNVTYVQPAEYTTSNITYVKPAEQISNYTFAQPTEYTTSYVVSGNSNPINNNVAYQEFRSFKPLTSADGNVIYGNPEEYINQQVSQYQQIQ